MGELMPGVSRMRAAGRGARKLNSARTTDRLPLARLLGGRRSHRGRYGPGTTTTAARPCGHRTSHHNPPGSMPLALITEAATGDVRNLVNSFAATGSFALVPMPVANTVVS